MGSRKYLVVLHVVSCGQNGSALGSDEQDILLLVYLVLDIFNNKVIKVNRHPVRPTALDVNENILSEEVRQEYQISDQEIKCAGSLRNVINDLDRSWREEIGGPFTILTDGQLHLRQCLFPEAFRKNISLPNYYHRFHDLRKEFQSVVSSSLSQEELTVDAMIRMLGVSPSCNTDPALRVVNNISCILQKFISDGYELHEPEQVQLELLQGIRTKNEQVDTNAVVRARGLPWQASDTDIARFFIGLNVSAGGVALCLSAQGRRNGEALVLFQSQSHRDMALKRHKHHIGNRYIEVYKATGEDFIEVAGGNNTEAQEFLARGGQVIIRMRGLPYDCSPKQVIDFFNEGDEACQVLDDEHGVLFVKKPDGRATGDAFVLFSEEKEGEKALSKHKELIGSRYIELFRSTTAEVQQVLNRSIDPSGGKGSSNSSSHHNHHHPHHQSSPLHQSSSLHPAAASGLHPTATGPLINGLAAVPPLPVIPQQLITAGIKKDCIRLRGLPYEAQVEHILEFLGDHARNIVVQGVHMVFNAQGQPSGEAFIQMDSETSANSAATNRHNIYMHIGKKQRYIEVLQCSGEDMSVVLTGGLAAPPPSTPSKSPLISPGSRVVSPHPYPPFSPVQLPSPAAPPPGPAAAGTAFPAQFPTHLLCWPYPSPPISPNRFIPYLSPSLLTTPSYAATAAPSNSLQLLKCEPTELNYKKSEVGGAISTKDVNGKPYCKPSVFIH